MASETQQTGDLTRKRCFNHSSREAAARCLTCGRFFCRECVTEHAGRVNCALCLGELNGEPTGRSGGLRRLRRWAACGAGVVVAWTIFYLLGKALLTIPTSFHEGTMWN